MDEVLSVVERGWRGARECSIELQRRGIKVTHLIKGRLPRDLRPLIRPYPLIRLIDVPRPLLRPCLWALLAAGRFRWLLVDHERTLRQVSGWCRGRGILPVLIDEGQPAYRLLVDGAPAELDRVFGARGNAT